MRGTDLDFLQYCDHDGLFADIHGMRHLFVTNLDRADVAVKMAQTLARHSDVRFAPSCLYACRIEGSDGGHRHTSRTAGAVVWLFRDTRSVDLFD